MLIARNDTIILEITSTNGELIYFSLQFYLFSSSFSIPFLQILEKTLRILSNDYQPDRGSSMTILPFHRTGEEKKREEHECFLKRQRRENRAGSWRLGDVKERERRADQKEGRCRYIGRRCAYIPFIPGESENVVIETPDRGQSPNGRSRKANPPSIHRSPSAQSRLRSRLIPFPNKLRTALPSKVIEPFPPFSHPPRTEIFLALSPV